MDDTLIIVEIPREATAINKVILHIHLMVTVDMTRHRKTILIFHKSIFHNLTFWCKSYHDHEAHLIFK